MQVLEQYYTADDKHIETLGRTDIPTEMLDLAQKVRRSLASQFGVHVTETGIQAELIKAIATESGDPDLDVPTWLAGETPLGITQPIVPRGVFRPLQA